MIYNEQKGDLFDLDEKFALAHCISADTNNPKSWGLGIVKEFRKRFPYIKEYVDLTMEKNDLTYPCVVIHYVSNNNSIKDDRVIFNLVTKAKYYSKPTYSTITKCIKEMACLCKSMNIKYLGMPKIGCGLDKLNWDKVKQIIKREFKDLDIQIEVRYLL